MASEGDESEGAQPVRSRLQVILDENELKEDQLQIPCTDEHLKKLANKLKAWEPLALSLGLTKDEVLAIKGDQKSLAALRKWKEKDKKKATYLKLAQKLEETEQLDLVEEILFTSHRQAKRIVKTLVEAIEVCTAL